MPLRSEGVREWLRIARGDLAMAGLPAGPEVPLELLCFHAQQAAEKAVKGALYALGIRPPKIHDLGVLLDLLPAEVARTEDVERSSLLTPYATVSRYPWGGARVTEDQYRDALRLAQAVVDWASEIIGA
jgi:HEPN domain-containing protein